MPAETSIRPGFSYLSNEFNTEFPRHRIRITGFSDAQQPSHKRSTARYYRITQPQCDASTCVRTAFKRQGRRWIGWRTAGEAFKRARAASGKKSSYLIASHCNAQNWLAYFANQLEAGRSKRVKPRQR